MSHDGQDPPTLGPRSRGPNRPQFSVITGGGGVKSDRPEPPALARSSLSQDGRQRLLRALRMLGGERAFLFVWDEQEFTLSEACACDETGAEPHDRNVMWSLLDRITSQRAPLVMAGTDDQPTDAMMSGVTAPLRMAIAVPLLQGENLRGVACFDKRIHKGQYVVADAHAAVVVLSALGVDAEHLPALQHGGDAPSPELRVEHMLSRLIEAMCPRPEEGQALGAHVSLAVPRPHEVCFWFLNERADGGQRIVTARLCMPQASDGDGLVAGFLACARSLSLLSEASPEDQLSGMAFEVERLKKDAFELHVTAIERNERDRSVSVWQAGDAGVLLVSATGDARQLGAPSKPLAKGVRSVTKTTLGVAPGERLLCVQREGLFEAGGECVIAGWLAARDANETEGLRKAVAQAAGPHAIVFWLEPT